MHTAQRHTTNSTRQKTESKHSLEKILVSYIKHEYYETDFSVVDLIF